MKKVKKVKKVVYFLGAGFSAPLGIPVMKDFYLKGRDLYFKEPEKFEYFLDVIKGIEKLSRVKNFFDSDLFNIEEILSLLEMGIDMGSGILKSTKRKAFLDFISDTVEHFAPKLGKLNKSKLTPNAHALQTEIFGGNVMNQGYASFVAGLFPIAFKNAVSGGRTNRGGLRLSISENPEAKYSIITLNYDCVIESFIKFLNENYLGSKELTYSRGSSGQLSTENNSIFLIKLHGSIDDGNIVPPTYNKQIRNKKLKSAWKTAYNLLKEAEYIRIIGYSLPETDINIRYLLKSSILESPNLQSIDVICLDEADELEKKYHQFVKFQFYKFYNVDVEEYLKIITGKRKLIPSEVLDNVSDLNYDVLETCHDEFKKKFKP